MVDSKTKPGRKIGLTAILSISAGIIGILVGRIFAVALQTTPAWIGPAILVGSIALLVIGLLLLPAMIRNSKTQKPAV